MKLKTYKLKPLEVTATQIQKGVDIIGVTWSKFYEDTAHVEMRRGQKLAKEGDWLIASPWGWDKIIPDEEFQKRYEESVQ